MITITITITHKMRALRGLMKVTDLQILNLGSRVMLLDDVAGWSDGFMAELNSLKAEKMRALAIVKDIMVPDTKPKFDRILGELSDPSPETEITDMRMELDDDYLTLVTEKHQTKCNPKYLIYFIQSYGEYIQLYSQGENRPIAVRSSKGTLLGVIMPVRMN